MGTYLFVGNIFNVGLMKAVVKVDSKGRVVIPKAIREKMGVAPGDLVVVCLEEGGISVKPLKSVADTYYGAYKVDRWPEDLDEFVVEALKKWWESRST